MGNWGHGHCFHDREIRVTCGRQGGFSTFLEGGVDRRSGIGFL